MSKRNIIFILFILFGISGLFTYFQSLPSLLEKKPTLATGKILARPMEIDQFELIDQNNAAFNNKSLKGGWTVLFFGYTNCPDVCPTTVTTLAAARDNLNSAGMDTKALQIIFITVDPERDTPEQLKQYLSLFDANVTGLTGSPDKVSSVLQQFGVYAQKNGQGDADYLYDHSAAIFLYRGDGSFKGTIVHNEPIAFITEKMKSIL